MGPLALCMISGGFTPHPAPILYGLGLLGLIATGILLPQRSALRILAIVAVILWFFSGCMLTSMRVT